MHQNKHPNKNKHVPVLLNEVLLYLEPKLGESYLDVTAGYGGHAKQILARTKNFKDSVLIDRDLEANHALTAEFKNTSVKILHDNYFSASQELISEGKQFDLILGDLGVSSPHLNEGMRGFAIHSTAPLDMRMDQRQKLDAYQVVNTYSEAKLAGILTDYGEEPKARQIARAIVIARPVSSTTELATIAASFWQGPHRSHPATRTFQAIRIAVNDELRLLQDALPVWEKLLKPDGRIVIISFHSLEDRIVKRALQEAGGDRYDATLKILTKSPVTASAEELAFNPRARSAKLRAAVKIKTKERER